MHMPATAAQTALAPMPKLSPTKVFVHTKNIVVVLASLLRNESFRADQDLVWGPEVITDEITESLAEGMDDHGYLSDVCHGWAYVSM